MNRERIFRLADRIENLSAGKFQMCYYIHSCGSASCIAGYTVEQMIEEGEIDDFPQLQVNIPYDAMSYLDLAGETADKLFKPIEETADYRMAEVIHKAYISPRRAAAVLRHLAETGDVDWSIWPLDAEVEPVIEELLENTTTPVTNSIPSRIPSHHEY